MNTATLLGLAARAIVHQDRPLRSELWPIQFPPDVDEQVRQQMQHGGYSSQDDVLREALRALQWRDEEVAAIQLGIEDMEDGRVESLREFDRDFRNRKNIPPDC